MEKRALLAVILSTVVLLAWYRLFMPAAPNTTAPNKEIKTEQKEQISPAPAVTLPVVSQPKKETKEITVKTKTSQIILTTRGAALVSWTLKEEQGSKGREEVDLVINKEPQLATLPSAIYQTDQEELILSESKKDGRVTFQYLSPEGLLILKTYTFSYEGQTFGLDIQVENRGKELAQPELSLSWGPGVGIDKDVLENSKKSMQAVFYKDKKFTKNPKPGDYEGQFSWIGVDNRYFLAALLPEKAQSFLVSVEKRDNLPLVNLAGKISLSPGQGEKMALKVYGGPKKYKELKALGRRLEDTCSFGMFSGLSIFMLDILGFFYRLTRNYGWAIVLLTIVVQIPLFPLTAKSFKSMRAMQQLQPLMLELRAKYKDDPRRLNVEMMNLYKKNKVNPFGGCLPMLLQLPVFWALFTALQNAFELRYAPFIFWIKDLSIADGVGANMAFKFGGSGLPLVGNSLNILVIAMGVLMFLQQKMSSTDPSQAKMVMFMPVLFTVMFWSFPSGLVIYWIVNSVVTIIGQYIIMKKPAPPFVVT
ncbi:MAG: membrane protein insertase YidC [bacterium]